jgi:hypothetical protein
MHARLTLAVALALLGVGVGVGGCASPEPSGALLAANAAAIPVFHRDIFDILYSVITGKDCSVVRLDKMQSYCRPPEPPPEPPPYCTRSLGTVDCWTSSAMPAGPGPSVADGPATLTPAQERDRTARWPSL